MFLLRCMSRWLRSVHWGSARGLADRKRHCASAYWYFFFQAEDGIRDYKVTGVQTCALPISRSETSSGGGGHAPIRLGPSLCDAEGRAQIVLGPGWTTGGTRQLHREAYYEGQEQYATTDDQAGSARENATGRPDEAVRPGVETCSAIGRSFHGGATDRRFTKANRRTQEGCQRQQ